jgi:hypothetical protein
MVILSILYTDEGTRQAIPIIDMQVNPAIDSAVIVLLLLLKMSRSVILLISGALEETTQVTPTINNKILGTLLIVWKWRGAFLRGLSIVCVCVCVCV